MCGEVVKVQRQTLEACMTCPLCNKIFVEATTIPECLHTFCKKCIYTKFTEEEFDCCPICQVSLGACPVDKLRPDHCWQDIRAKIFHHKQQEDKTLEPKSSVPEVTDTVQVCGKRKEQSSASLVVTIPEVSSSARQPDHPGRRSRSIARRNPAAQEHITQIEETINKEDYHHESERASVPVPVRSAQARAQNFSAAKSSRQHIPANDVEESAEDYEGSAGMCSSFNCLAATNPVLVDNPAEETPVAIEPPPRDSKETELFDLNVDITNQYNVLMINHDEQGSILSPPPENTTRMETVQQKRPVMYLDLNLPAQEVVEANRTVDQGFPIWFSLVASDKQEGNAPLPQISSRYLRIKDPNLPVSHIKKYLVKKLDLANEAEVEILLRGQAVSPTLLLHNLVNSWCHTAPVSEGMQGTIGSPAHSFVMELSYGRKVLP